MEPNPASITRVISAMLVISVFSFFGLAAAEAQIYNCDGKWSNKPCDGEPTKVIKAAPERSGREESLLRSRKESLLHELRMAAIAAKRNFGVELTGSSSSLADVERHCEDPATSVESCGARIDKARSELDTKVQQAAALQEKKRAEEREKKDDDDFLGDINDVDVVVDPGRGDGDLIVVPCRPINGVLPRHCGGGSPTPGPGQNPANRPKFEPGPFSDEKTRPGR